MQIGFHGAARTVTGSKYLLTLDRYRLLVDCGLFQGGFEMHQRNWRPPESGRRTPRSAFVGGVAKARPVKPSAARRGK